MRIGSVLTDLDGTLLEHGGVLGDEARAAIARLRGLGVPVVPLTSKTEVELRMSQLYLSNGIGLDEFLDRWQFPNISAACAKAKLRADYDAQALERAWIGLAPRRAGMELPPCS